MQQGRIGRDTRVAALDPELPYADLGRIGRVIAS